MNSKIAVAIGLAAIFVTAFAVPTQNVFAATVQASIVSGASTKADQAFSPNPLEVSVGDTVTWTNDDSQPHTVTSGSGSAGPSGEFDSGINTILTPGKTFSHTFETAGDFSYYCQLHPTMMGLVKVAAGGTTGGGTGNATGGNTTGGGNATSGEFTVTATLDDKTYNVTGKSATAKATEVTITPSKSVTVKFEGTGDVELTLPNDMIEGITSVQSGGQAVQFTPTNGTDSTTLKFTVPASGSVDIMGARVVPEFSVLAALVLAGSLVAIVALTRVSKGNGLGFFGRM